MTGYLIFMKLPLYPLRGKDIFVFLLILQYFIAYGEIGKYAGTNCGDIARRAYTIVEPLISSNFLYLVEVQQEHFSLCIC